MVTPFMTIWDVIPDPGPAVASLIDDDRYPGPQRIPMPPRGRRIRSLFDVHPEQFPIQELAAYKEEAPAPGPVKARPSPSAEDVAYVQAAILDILPKGWPSYAKEVLGVRRVPSNGENIFVGTRTAIVATLRLFDGEIGWLRLEGVPGCHGYSWKLGRRDKRPFHWDEAAGKWARVDEPEAKNMPPVSMK